MAEWVMKKLKDIANFNPRETLAKGAVAKKIAMDKLQPFCRDVAKQDYILTPGRYVGIEEQKDDDESFEEKMSRLTSELSDMFKRSRELEDEIRRKLGGNRI